MIVQADDIEVESDIDCLIDVESELNPFTVVVDTREQSPWHFTGIRGSGGAPLIVPLSRDRSLKSGDYSILGLEDLISIERKSVSDWFGSIGRERQRFEAEMERLSSLQFAAVVIEGGWNELLLERPGTQMTAKSVSRTIAAWSVRYGVHFFPCLNRRHAELFAFSLLSLFWRDREREIADLLDGIGKPSRKRKHTAK